MNRLTCIISLLVLGLMQPAFGYVFSDDFSRDSNVPRTTIGSAIGSKWVIPPDSSEWEIAGNPDNGYLTGRIIKNNSIIYNTTLPIADTFSPDSPTTISLDVKTARTQSWIGMAFNVIDNENYYIVRLRTEGNNPAQMQVLQVVDGAIQGGSNTIASIDLGSSILVNTWYNITLNIGTSSLNDYSLVIRDLSGAEPSLVGSYNFSTNLYHGGYAGIYSNSQDGSFDNFKITTQIPETRSTVILMCLGIVLALGLRQYKRARRIS